MYIPSSFVEQDRSHIVRIMRESPLATVITGGDEPQVSQAPTLVSEQDEVVSVEFHLAVNNPQCERLHVGASCVILHGGPNCYVSPSWYAQHPSVPTWNYVSVEARGVVQQLSHEELAAQVTELSRIHERRVGGTWEYDDLPDEFRQRLLKGIRGFRVTVTQLAAKVKLSQNRSLEDRRIVADRLVSSPDPLDQRVGRLMIETLKATESPAALR